MVAQAALRAGLMVAIRAMIAASAIASIAITSLKMAGTSVQNICTSPNITANQSPLCSAQ
jgi:hypothetical protein